MKWKYLLLFFMLFEMGCKHTTSQNEQFKNDNTNMKKAVCNADSIKALKKGDAIKKLGVPLADTCFVLDDLQGEFRISLNNFFTKKERLSKAIKINECTWEKDNTHNITIWYRKNGVEWIPVDTLVWEKASEF